MLINGAFKEANFMNNINNNVIVDHNKFRRERIKEGKEAVNRNSLSVGQITALYFDGKKYETMGAQYVSTEKYIDGWKRSNSISNSSIRRKINTHIKEEHCMHNRAIYI